MVVLFCIFVYDILIQKKKKKTGKESQYIVSRPELGSDPPIGSDLELGCDRVRLRVNDTICHLQRQPAIWERPVDGMLKLNVDAALFLAKGLVGVGCVLRDSTGSFIAAKATTVNLQVQPHEAEAVGVREALSWIKHDNRLNIIVEMDAKLVYDALCTSPISNSPFGMIIEDCKEMAVE